MLGKLLRLLSRRQDAAGGQFRESSSRTTIHLLEMNRKFELFMRARVRKLEERVSRLQARPGQGQAEGWADEDGYAFSQSGDGNMEDIRMDEEMNDPDQTAPPGVSPLGGWQAVNEVEPAPSPAIEIGLSGGDDKNLEAAELEEAEISSSPLPAPTSVIPAGGGISLLSGSTGAGGPAEMEEVETSPAPAGGAVDLDGKAADVEEVEASLPDTPDGDISLKYQAEKVSPGDQGQGQIPAPASASMLGGYHQLAGGQSDRGSGISQEGEEAQPPASSRPGGHTQVTDTQQVASLLPVDSTSTRSPATDDQPLPVEETELLDAEEEDEVGVEAWEDRELKGDGVKSRFA